MKENCRTTGEKNPGSAQVFSASYSLYVVLAQSLGEAKRPSDLKVSPFDTTRPPVVCCWRHPRDRKRERVRREMEKERRKQSQRQQKSERDMERNNKKQRKNSDTDTAKQQREKKWGREEAKTSEHSGSG